jgi:toxin ParE1/3/4
MKTLPVQLREAAIADLDEIATYIAENSGYAAVALKFVERIRGRCERIGDAPMSGIARPDLGTSLRMVPFEHSTVIIYQITGDAVEIVSVFYGGRDYESLMRDNTA